MLLRRAYALLLRLHPRHFRNRYGQEMLWIYDESVRGDRTRLFADAIVSVLRQRLLRDVDDALSPSTYNRTAGPVFATIDSSRLPLFSLWQGGAAAVLAWFALGILITAGSDRSRLEFASVHYLIDSRVHPPRVPIGAAGLTPPLPPASSTTGVPYSAADLKDDRAVLTIWTKVLSVFGVKRSNDDAADGNGHLREASHRLRMFPLKRNEKSRSVRTILVLPALPAAQADVDQLFRRLDRNWDGRLSAGEIESAPEVLRSLDQDRDGKVTAEECGILRAAVASQQRPAGAFRILDRDGNGELSEAEIARASTTLRVARDRDGSVARSAVKERNR